MDKIFALAKDTRIKVLEYFVVKVGYDPRNINVAEELVRKKNTDIATLIKQLKFLATKDPLVEDIEETESKKA